ncbi:MAG: dihydropteroate synthase [Arsenophonus sp.]|nr:MAG: dihydropteroate synthase [Arsenophonus sp.]
MKITISKKKYSCPMVMGILNITPDSFYDGGLYQNYNKAIDHVANMINSGAEIIDIGGESTRPGSLSISAEQELDRIIPVVKGIKKRFNILVSVDTSKAIVMKKVEKLGVDIINDVRSLKEDSVIETLSNNNLKICIMHMPKKPKNMQKNIFYTNVIKEVNDYLIKIIERCKKFGINKNRLIIDPGFGFGKKMTHNYQLLANLNYFHILKLPILVGISRKSMIGELLNLSTSQRMIGSLAASVIAAMQGVSIIRTHDVKETVECMKIVKKTLSFLKKNYYE